MTPNRTDNRTQSAAEFLEQELQEAHLLCVRREYAQAKALLTRVNAQFPGNREVQYLLGRIAATENAAAVEVKEEDDKRRQVRFSLGLETTWRRFWWGLGGIALVVYGVAGEAVRLPVALHDGLASPLTTMMDVGSRYNRHLEPYTRPVWYDLLYYAAAVVLGIGVFALVRYAARGAAQWEELDAQPRNRGGWGGWGGWWWP